MLKKNYKHDLKKIGNEGENVAADFLKRKGYKIIEKNFWCYQGEIDIIAKKEKEYIFCEVKTRKNMNYGKPIDSITYIKQKHIWEATRYYVYKNQLYDTYIRFDVIEVYISNGNKYINHIKNVELN